MTEITYTTETTLEGTLIHRVEADGKVWSVPEKPGNRHYDEYLEWLADGNEPEVIGTTATDSEE